MPENEDWFLPHYVSYVPQGPKWNAPSLWQFQYEANFLVQADRSGAV